ncbi:MAG TPA: GNAT family N-acetyltransferase [Candidatus Dormibacteraeota bacterium]|jgi:ribosomal protein S18 acetylase RimI-like enzyme|nr:GNAT family N-acetyltransferase [Candidatus Dormibacteraeota bacterium]
MSISVRRAGTDDAPELTRLRVQMFADMGRDVAALDEEWRAMVTDHFTERLADVERFAGFVVDRAPGRLAACSVGWLDRHLPSSFGGGGDVGHIANVSTDPAWRRRGYARATMSALVEWMRTRDVQHVDLNATSQGEGLYRSLGFSAQAMVALRLRLR